MVIRDGRAVVQGGDPPHHVDVDHPGAQPYRPGLQQLIVHALPQRTGATDRIGKTARGRRRRAGQTEARHVRRGAAAAQRRPFVVDVLEWGRPHLVVVGAEKLVKKFATEIVPVIVGEVVQRGIREQVGRHLGELLLDGRGHQTLRPAALEPHPAVTGDVVHLHARGVDRAVELREVAVQHVAAKIPGETLFVADRRGHATDLIAGIHHHVVDPEFGQPDCSAQPRRAGTDNEKGRHRVRNRRPVGPVRIPRRTSGGTGSRSARRNCAPRRH